MRIVLSLPRRLDADLVRTVSTTATQPTRTIQRSVMTMKRYPPPRPEEITEAAPNQDRFADSTGRSRPILLDQPAPRAPLTIADQLAAPSQEARRGWY